MPEDEALDWCQTWDIEQDVSHYCKWTPIIEPANPVVTQAVELVWGQTKTLRAPCLSGDGRPAIWFTSQPILNPGPNRRLGDTSRASIVECNASVHTPILPTCIATTDRSDETEAVLNIGEVNNSTPEDVADLVLARIDFSGIWTKPEFCGRYWINEIKQAERGPRCPRCGKAGTGEGRIGNERRFFHQRNRSCYLGVVETKLKRNPLVKCGKCGEMGREHHGKDGHVRIRHNDRVCYIG